MNTKFKRPSKFILLLLIPVFIAAIGFAVMFLWNWLLPNIIGVKAINFWQALGLFVLSKILFGNFGGSRKHQKPSFNNKAFKQKFMEMTTEEKQQFRNEWKKRCNE